MSEFLEKLLRNRVEKIYTAEPKKVFEHIVGLSLDLVEDKENFENCGGHIP